MGIQSPNIVLALVSATLFDVIILLVTSLLVIKLLHGLFATIQRIP